MFRECRAHISTKTRATRLYDPKLIGLLAVFNVDVRAIPFDDHSRVVYQRHTAHQKPAVLSIGTANAPLLLEDATTRDRLVPLIDHFRKVVRMEGESDSQA